MGAYGKEIWERQQASTLFRRGTNMESAGERFIDVVRGIQEVTATKDHVRGLSVGVARAQEPASLLVVLDSVARSKNKTLDSFVDLHLVDLRPRLNRHELETTTYKFIIDDLFWNEPAIMNGLERDRDRAKYKIKEPIIDFLANTIDDPEKSIWDTPIQEYLATDPPGDYDFIAYNNVDLNVIQGRETIIEGLLARLSTSGILITDSRFGADITLKRHPRYTELKQEYALKEIAPGIFQRGK